MTNENEGNAPELKLDGNTPEPPVTPPEKKSEPPADEVKVEEPYRATCYAGSFRRVTTEE